MGIIQVIRSSFFDPAFYAGMRERSWGEAAKYYAVVAFVIVFAYVSPLWALLLAANPQLIDTATAVFPDNLEITVADGTMHINQPLPYAIPNTFTKELPEHIAVFDTDNDDFSPTALTDARTLILFKKTFAVVRNTDSTNPTGEQRVFSYGTSSATTTLTKAKITAFTDTIKPYVRPVAIIGGAFLFVLAVLIGGVGLLVFHLVYLLVPALLVYLFFKLRRQPETFHTAYVIALFASIPVAIIAAIAGLFGGLPPLTYTAILLLIVVVNCARSTPAN